MRGVLGSRDCTTRGAKYISRMRTAHDLATRARRYARNALRDDLLAACIVAVLLIPQSLAYALLAGLPPQVGLYASLLPLVAYAALGSSPVLGVGPVAVLALMISQALAQAPAGVSAQDAALVLAAEVGLLLAAAAWLRLDALACRCCTASRPARRCRSR